MSKSNVNAAEIASLQKQMEQIQTRIAELAAPAKTKLENFNAKRETDMSLRFEAALTVDIPNPCKGFSKSLRKGCAIDVEPIENFMSVGLDVVYTLTMKEFASCLKGSFVSAEIDETGNLNIEISNMHAMQDALGYSLVEALKRGGAIPKGAEFLSLEVTGYDINDALNRAGLVEFIGSNGETW